MASYGTQITNISISKNGSNYAILYLYLSFMIGGNVQCVVGVTNKGTDEDADLNGRKADTHITDYTGVSNLKPPLAVGDRVVITIYYSTDSGLSQSKVLCTGVISGYTGAVESGSDYFATTYRYIVSSDVARLDTVPLGAIAVSSPNADNVMKVMLTNINNNNNMLGNNTGNKVAALGKYKAVGGKFNIAKMTADILDGTCILDSKLNIPPARSINSAVDVDKAPGIKVSEAYIGEIKNFIVQTISDLYASARPLDIFKQVLNAFFLTLAPATGTDKATVICDNAWSKKVGGNIGLGDIIAYRHIDNTDYEKNEGAVGVVYHPTDNSGTKTVYYVCGEGNKGGKPFRIDGKHSAVTGVTKSSKGSLVLTDDDGNVIPANFRLIALPQWTRRVILRDNAVADSIARYIALATYGSINRSNSTVSISVPLIKAFDHMNNIGKIYNIASPQYGTKNPLYGRLASFNLNITIAPDTFRCSTELSFTHVRTKQEQDVLYIDNPLYDED